MNFIKTRKLDDNDLQALLHVFGVKYNPETFESLTDEEIARKVDEIITPEMKEKINDEINRSIDDLLNQL
jgi:hypothetical protein